MQGSNAFRDQVLSTALKGFKFDEYSGKIVSDLRLSSKEINVLVDTARNVFGVESPSQARLLINSIVGEPDPFSTRPETQTTLRLDNIPKGDTIELTHGDGTVLRLIAVSDHEFRVIHDSGNVLQVSDCLRPLSLLMVRGMPLYFEVRRAGGRYPDDQLFYAVSPVTSITVTRNDISSMRFYISSESLNSGREVELPRRSLPKARAFRTDFSGRAFIGSTLEDVTCTEAPFEIDFENMTLNVDIENVPDDEMAQMEIINELLRVCDSDGTPIDNLYRLVCLTRGVVELVESGVDADTFDIRIVQPPKICQK